MSRGVGLLALLAASLVGALFSVYLVVHAHGVNGAHGFPIDDTWIHLTYARNLIEQGEFAYFPGDPTTSGSTSPLYTVWIAAALATFGESKVTVYGFGIACHLGFLFVTGLWAWRRTASIWLAIAAVLLLGFSRHLAYLSVSGMETSLFLLLVALSFLAFAARRPLLLGGLLGLAVWARTDALILATVLLIAWGLQRFWTAGASPAMDGRRIAFPLLALTAAYLGFNRVLGGAWLPTTFAGKTAYYAQKSAADFLPQVAQCFGVDGWRVLWPLAVLGVGIVGVQLLRRRDAGLAPEAGLVVGWVLAYMVMLPFAGRAQRYLVPALPAFVVLSVAVLGLAHRGLVARGRPAFGAGLCVVVLGAAGWLHVDGAVLVRAAFARTCDYHARRHERVGHWLRENTPPDAVIATHDIGAIAYYSRRRVIDLVGLVRPDVIEHLNTPGYTGYLEDLLAETGVSYVATLRNWLEVDNEAPLFVADPEPEILEVYAWRPGRHHLVDPTTTAMREAAGRMMLERDFARARESLEKIVTQDPRSARSWAALGRAATGMGDWRRAGEAYRRALSLNPDNQRTRRRLAAALRQLGQPAAAERVESGK